MSDKIYIGKGKPVGNFDELALDICLSDIPKKWIKKSTKNGKSYLKIKVQNRREADEYGNTKNVIIDTFVPDQNYKKEPKEVYKAVIVQPDPHDDLPF